MSERSQKMHQALVERTESREQLALLTRYSVHQRSEALTLFLSDNLEPAAIAMQLGLPLTVIEHFAREDKWIERRKDIEVQLVEATASVERRLILEHRPKVRRRHLAAAEEFEEKARSMLGDTSRPLSPANLKMATDAFAVAAGVAARAAGIGEDGLTAEDKKVNVTVAPVIMIGAGPRAPQMKQVLEEQHDEHPEAQDLAPEAPRAITPAADRDPGPAEVPEVPNDRGEA
jgi:hypothetical protein